MTDLEHLFSLQAALQRRMAQDGKALGVPDLSATDVREAERLTRENVLALFAELGELLDSVNWKSWKTWREDSVNRPNLVVEIVDCLHFLINICLTWGITPAELVAGYEAEHAENHRRQQEGY